MFRIKMFKSGYGESILVTICSSDQESITLLIDCGFGFDNEIKPKLQEIGKIDRLILTHFDNDHINGARKLLEGYSNNNIKVEQVWLNTYRHMQIKKHPRIELNDRKKEQLEAFNCANRSAIEEEKTEHSISASQAIEVGSLIIKNELPWNTDFNQMAVSIENKQQIPISNNVSIILLSPDRKKLDGLEFKFRKAIYDNLNIKEIPEDKIFDDAFEWFVQHEYKEVLKNIEYNISARTNELSVNYLQNLASPEKYKSDTSEANGSSIAFILQTDHKKVLFLADSHAEIVEEQLKKLYPKHQSNPILFDAIKISHHGAQGNTSPGLLKIVDSPKYIFSTNGKHPKGHIHPDMETIARILTRKLSNDITQRELIFNYELEHLNPLLDCKLKEHFKYDILIQDEVEL